MKNDDGVKMEAVFTITKVNHLVVTLLQVLVHPFSYLH